VLRRRLRISLPLTQRLARLRQTLATHTPPLEDDSSLLWAAVAAILVPSPDAILLIQRAERHGDPWSGHMALPGGRREPSDTDLLATAVRETREEVGISLGSEAILGRLEDVVPRIPTLPPIAVRPFVFLLDERPNLVLNTEVAAARWVTLDDLLKPGAYASVHLEHIPGRRVVQAYQVGQDIIWGMTERILTSLAGRLQGSIPAPKP
jgi:8-oxo-dGTP pyrophosphatase MutT (NUDIX family)